MGFSARVKKERHLQTYTFFQFGVYRLSVLGFYKAYKESFCNIHICIYTKVLERKKPRSHWENVSFSL